MSPLILKEIRLLLPSWAVSLLLALSVGLIPQEAHSDDGFLRFVTLFLFLLSPTMLVMTALSSFGGELSPGLFSLLLAQPVPRRRIWWTKTLLLAAAVLSMWLAWCVSRVLCDPLPMVWRDWWFYTGLPTGLFVLAVYSGGLWAVLLFRQVVAAFWFTVLTPVALFMTVGNLLENYNYPDKVIARVATVVFIIYGLAGFWFARRLFMRAQDVQWAGGTISLPEVRGLARFKLTAGTRRHWRPRTALFIRELQLYQSQLLMAGVLVLLHLGVIATHELGHFPKNSTVEFILEAFWMLWLVMPLLVGCAAVAEERKAGTLESQLCLPVRRATQFAVKALVALGVAVLLGAVMPWLLAGGRIFPDAHFDARQIPNAIGYSMPGVLGILWLTLLNILATLSPILPFLLMALISTGIAALAFYASTLTRNTLQALGPAVLGILLVVGVSIFAFLPEAFVNYPLWRGWMIYLIGVPVMVAVIGALAYRNYQRVLIGWRDWRRNLLTLTSALALIAVTTAAIYHRVWERLTPLEPPHGAVRLTLRQPPLMRASGRQGGLISVVLPDGRAWLNRYAVIKPNLFQEKIIPSPMFGGGKFLAGTNWAEVTDNMADILGIQRDGSLWVSETPERRIVHWGLGERPTVASTRLVRFGDECDWKAAANRFHSAFLLKSDGSLWYWGTNRWDWHKAWPGLRGFTPERLGTNSDWTGIFAAGRIYFRKADGQVWVYPPFSDNQTKLPLGHNLALGRVAFLEKNQCLSMAETWFPLSSVIGVLEDGTLHILAQQGWNGRDWASRDSRLGREGDWVTVAVHDEQMVTLKRDGSLWLWDFHWGPRSAWSAQDALDLYRNTEPVRLGTHSDWVAIGSMDDGAVALAADGSLWLWRFDSSYFFDSNQKPHWLAVSRKPVSLGNIFGQAD